MSYNNEYKRKVIDRYNSGESISDICLKTGIAISTLYYWIKSFDLIDTETVTAVLSMREYNRLTQRIQKLEKIITILKAVDCTVSSPLKDKLSNGITAW